MEKHKIIFIEGLPGSGKTTFAKKLYEYLSEQNLIVKQYSEGMHNPLSLAWQSLLTEKEYEKLLNLYPSLASSIKENTIKQINHHVLAYTLVKVPEEHKDFYDYAKKFEIYKHNKKTFITTYQKLYEEFSSKNQYDGKMIFECALLQNHVNQMLAVYHLPKEEIIDHFKKMINDIKEYKPLIIYVKQTNIEKTLNKIAGERLSHNKNMFPDWIDMAINYLESTPYGQKMNLKGKAGLLSYFHCRQSLELEILSHLDIDYKVLELDDNYEEVFELMKQIDY